MTRQKTGISQIVTPVIGDPRVPVIRALKGLSSSGIVLDGVWEAHRPSIKNRTMG